MAHSSQRQQQQVSLVHSRALYASILDHKQNVCDACVIANAERLAQLTSKADQAMHHVRA